MPSKFSYIIPAARLTKGLRPFEESPKDENFLIESKGALGVDGVLATIDVPTIMYTYFTSMPYPLVVEEEMALATVNLLKGDSLPHIREYSQLSNIELVTGIFKQTLKTYELTEAELISVDLVSGIFKCAMIAYSDWPVEETKLSFINLIAGSFRVSMINYENWPVEETKLTSIALTGGLHETS